MKIKLTLFFLLAVQYLYAANTFDSLYTLLTSQPDLFVDDRDSTGRADLMLLHLQQYPDTAHAIQWITKIQQQKEYYKAAGNEKTYALLALSEFCLYDNLSLILKKSYGDSIAKETEVFLPILKKYKLQDLYATGFVYLGRFYLGKNENKALSYFLLGLAQKSSVSWVNSLAAFNLGVIYRRAGNYEKAIEYMKLGFKYNPTNYGAYNLISFYYAHLHQCDSADVYFHLAEKNIEEADNFYIRAKAYNFLCKGLYDSALVYMHVCIDFWKTQAADASTYHYLIYFNRDLYRIYKAKHETLKQQAALNEIKYCTDHTGFDLMGIQAAIMGLEVLEQNAYETHNYKDAYIYKTKLFALHDSAQTLGNLNVYESIQAKNNYEQKLSMYEDESLRKEEVAAHKWQRQKKIGIAAIILFAFLLFLAALQFRNNTRLTKEKKRSEALLLNILPAEVAEELKEKGSAEAKMFNNVTIMFTDFKSFTTVSEHLTPQQLVDELHTCFSAFDKIIAKHKVEKIKTVGDAYLAVSGMPVANANHAIDIVLAAIEIREFIKQRRSEKGNSTFDIRIGIHSGSVVAGIVGVKKFAYDIWGDTVNTAARMEQNSEAGRINISEATFTLVKNKFSCQYRGEIEAKNKGKLKMYFLN